MARGLVRPGAHPLEVHHPRQGRVEDAIAGRADAKGQVDIFIVGRCKVFVEAPELLEQIATDRQ